MCRTGSSLIEDKYIGVDVLLKFFRAYSGWFLSLLLIYLCGLAPAYSSLPASDLARITQSELLNGPVRPFIGYLEDPAGTLTIDDALKVHRDGGFQTAPEGFNGGFTESVFWFQFDVHLRSEQQDSGWQELYLELEYPHIDKLRLYHLQDGRIIHELGLGDQIAFSERPIPTHEFVVPVRLPVNRTSSFFMRVESANLMQMPLALWHKDRFLQVYGDLNLVNGVFFGLVLIMALYNLFIGIMIRDKTFFLYFCYFAAFGLFVFSYFGFGFKFLWPGTPWLNDFSLPVLAFVMQGFGLLFSRAFLDTQAQHPGVNRVLLGAVLFCVLMLPLCFLFSYRVMITVAISSGLLVAVLVNLAGIVSLLQGRKHARFYVVGWSSVMVGWVVFNLAQKDLLPLNFFTLHAVQFGAILEVLFLSLALGDQINRVTEEKNRVQHQARTELQEKNRELSEMLRKVQESNELKDQFLATISHELRTPMNGIEGSLEIVREVVDNPEADRPLHAARESAHLMTKLLESLLEFSELQSGSLKISHQPFVLQKVIEEGVAECRNTANAREVAFNVEISPPECPPLIADGARIQLVLFHLADNAVKFTPQGAVDVSVKLITQADSPCLLIEVRDSGTGIPPDKQDVIFERFRQVDGSFSRKYGGFGIGLALSKALVDKMGGELKLVSEEGKGTCVTVRIPVRLGQETAAAKNSIPDLDNRRILIVEDNPVNQMTLRAIVEKLGCRVVVANNGQEAVQCAEQEAFDCILMDCQMPVMDGFEATAILRKEDNLNTATPIIAVTANAMSADKERCLAVGMNDYIKKPVKKAIIAEKLAQYLSSASTG